MKDKFIPFKILFNFVELDTNVKETEGVADESVTPIREFFEPGIEWLKDSVPPLVTEGSYEIISKDSFHESVIPKISAEDTRESQEKSGDLQIIVQQAIDG